MEMKFRMRVISANEECFDRFRMRAAMVVILSVGRVRVEDDRRFGGSARWTI
jgi:hypothetical protein